MIRVEGKTEIREMVDYDANVVEKNFDKRLNMEYDWKLCASRIAQSSIFGHLAFNTKPWDTVEQFNRIRGYWMDYSKNSPKCVKFPENFYEFASFVETRSFVDTESAKYMRKKDGDLMRLR